MDDINLLPPAIIALIAETYDRGAHIMEREGFSERQKACFIPLASMNPEEGVLSPHFLDRFGMCVALNTLGEGATRMEIVKTAGRAKGTDEEGKAGLDDLRRRVARARRNVCALDVPREIEDYIVRTLPGGGCAGPQGRGFPPLRSRVLTPLIAGDGAVGESHVDAVSPLVLSTGRGRRKNAKRRWSRPSIRKTTTARSLPRRTGETSRKVKAPRDTTDEENGKAEDDDLRIGDSRPNRAPKKRSSRRESPSG